MSETSVEIENVPTEPVTNVPTEETTFNPIGHIYQSVTFVYSNRYYWECVKSAVVFLLGLKLAQECYHIAIPMKEYEPFQAICSRGCR